MQLWPTFYLLLDLRSKENKLGRMGGSYRGVSPSRGCPIKGVGGCSYPTIPINIGTWEIPSAENSIYCICPKEQAVGFHRYQQVVQVTLQFPLGDNIMRTYWVVICFSVLIGLVNKNVALLCCCTVGYRVCLGAKLWSLMSALVLINPLRQTRSYMKANYTFYVKFNISYTQFMYCIY